MTALPSSDKTPSENPSLVSTETYPHPFFRHALSEAQQLLEHLESQGTLEGVLVDEHDETAALTETAHPESAGAARSVTGHPRLLTRDRNTRLMQILRLDFFLLSRTERRRLIRRNGKEPRKTGDDVRLMGENSISRQTSIVNAWADRAMKHQEIPHSVSLELAILRDYFDWPRIDYLDPHKRPRPKRLKQTLCETLDTDQARELLSQGIDNTFEFFLGIWMIWPTIHRGLLDWKSLEGPKREEVVLGLFVLVTISSSLAPVLLGQQFVPELAEEFADLRETSCDGEPDYNKRRSTSPLSYRKIRALMGAAQPNATEAQRREALDRFLDLTAREKQGSTEAPTDSGGLSAAQLLSRLRKLVETHRAQWLAPALAEVTTIWSLPEEGKAGKPLRAEALEQTATLLNEHTELAAEHATLSAQIQSQQGQPRSFMQKLRGADEGVQDLRTRLEECETRSAAIEREVLQIVLRGRKLLTLQSDSQTPSTASALPAAGTSKPAGKDHVSLGIAGSSNTPAKPPTGPSTPPAKTPPATGQGSAASATDPAASRIRLPDLLWNLVQGGQLTRAYWYWDALRTDLPEADFPLAPLLRAAALAPFVTDEPSAAAATYHDTLMTLDLYALERGFQQQRTLGLYACGLAASLQGALFFPISGAARLLRFSNHKLPPDLTRLCFAIANLGEQAIHCKLADFASDRAAEADDSSYRRSQVRSIVQTLGVQLPVALAFFREAAKRQANLEDRAGCALAAQALEALLTTLSGVKPKAWDSGELAEWLALPQLARAESSSEINFTPIAERVVVVSYAALAQSTIQNGHFRRARALLYELERTGSGEKYAFDLRFYVQQGFKCLGDCGEQAASLTERLREAFDLGLISAHDHQAYQDWVAALAMSLKRSPENPAALLQELQGIGRELDEHYSARLAELQDSATSLWAALQQSGPGQEWAEELKRTFALGNIEAAQECLKQVRAFLNDGGIAPELLCHRVVEAHPDHEGDRQTSRSPLTVRDEHRIAGIEGAGTRLRRASTEGSPPLTLVFGVPAAGIGQVPRVLESLPALAHTADTAAAHSRVVSAHTVSSLSALRVCTDALAQTPEPQLLHIDMPAVADDPALQEEVLEHLYGVNPRVLERCLAVVLTFGPSATWQWLATGGLSREARWATVRLAPWTRGAIKTLLSELHFPTGLQQVESLEHATGGWQLYVHSLTRTAQSESSVDTLEAVLQRDREIPARLDPEAARRALRAFGVFDVPLVYSFFADLIAMGLHGEFDRDLLSLALAEKSDYAGLSVELLVTWSVRLGLFSPLDAPASDAPPSGPERFRLHPTVATLVERGGVTT